MVVFVKCLVETWSVVFGMVEKTGDGSLITREIVVGMKSTGTTDGTMSVVQRGLDTDDMDSDDVSKV